MVTVLSQHRRFFVAAALAGLVLRLAFLVYFPTVTDDSHVYLNLATNWMQHGIYGQMQGTEIVPTSARLPGYPSFLAVIFSIFGVGNIRAVLLAQIVIDMATCLLIADLARRTIRTSMATRAAFALAATCPFLANYAAAALTETLEIFFTVVALDCAAAGLERLDGTNGTTGRGVISWPLWIATGAAIGASILVRPDGGLLIPAVIAYLVVMWARRLSPTARRAMPSARLDSTAARLETPATSQASSSVPSISFFAVAAISAVLAVTALSPLVPWTLRNLHTLHRFQPLAPRYANESDELAPRGFNRWVKTWMAEYASVEEIYWNVPGDKIDVDKLPARALDEPGRAETLATIAQYNQSQDLTPALDARFGELATERVKKHPFRSYLWLPALRVADMWLRPRTEILPPDPRWWEFNDDRRESALAVGFGVLNLAYVAAAMLALTRNRTWFCYLGLLASFVLLRTLFLGTVENPEPRYTLECYPVILVWASALFARL